MFFIPLLISKRNRKNIEIISPSFNLIGIYEILKMFATFLITCFAWIFFRAENLNHALKMISRIFSKSLFTEFRIPISIDINLILIILTFFISIEWIGRKGKYGIEWTHNIKHRFLRWGFYSFILFLIGMYMQTKETPFIYFQF